MRYSEANTWIAREMLLTMPDKKKEQYIKAVRINCHHTSAFDLDEPILTIYKEGFYLTAKGCRCSFTLWARDNDGELIFEKRKPNESKLHELYGEYLHHIKDIVGNSTINEWNERF